MKKIFILPLSGIVLLLGAYIYWSRPPVAIMDTFENNCRIFTGDHFQKMRCYKNALSMYLNYPEFRDTALVAFQDLCNEGLSNACFAKDELRKESSMNFSPFQEHIDNGNLDAVKCINKATNPQDEFIKDYYCNKALTYGKLLKDSFLISEIQQNWQPFTAEHSLAHIEHNLVFNEEYNKDLYQKNCNKIITSNQKDYCSKFIEVNILRKRLYDNAYSNKPNLKEVNLVVNEICKKFTLSCYLLSEETDLIIQIYKLYPKNEKSNFLADFKSMLSFEKRLLIWAFIQDIGALESTAPSTFQDKILKSYYSDDHDTVLKLCQEESSTNLEGCFLGFRNFKEAANNPSVLENFCQKGDKFSCKVLIMKKNNRLLNIADSYKMNLLYHNYDLNVLRSYIDNPTRKFILFLDRHRASLLLIAIGLIFLIQVFIIVLFKRSEHVFQYIRSTTVEKLKNKINKSTNDE